MHKVVLIDFEASEEELMMNYNIRGEKQLEVTPAIREHAEKRLGRLERYFEDTAGANVNMNMSVRADKMHKVEVTVTMKSLVLRAEDVNRDMYAAIDLVIEKLERQIRKHKTKVNRKWREQSPKDLFTPATLAESVPSDLGREDELEIVRTKRFGLKPMSAEEAVLQMNLIGHDFYVYADAETNDTHIVYKRKGGKYGLIQAN